MYVLFLASTLQHKDTSDNTSKTTWDFTEENYKRVGTISW